jgi:hypothetical protein
MHETADRINSTRDVDVGDNDIIIIIFTVVFKVQKHANEQKEVMQCSAVCSIVYSGWVEAMQLIRSMILE